VPSASVLSSSSPCGSVARRVQVCALAIGAANRNPAIANSAIAPNKLVIERLDFERVESGVERVVKWSDEVCVDEVCGDEVCGDEVEDGNGVVIAYSLEARQIFLRAMNINYYFP
jgi:hypothetical protein